MTVLEIEKKDHVATVTLNRPDARNALDPELIVRLAQAWDDIRADDDIRAVVLTSSGGSTFCAGFDLAKSIPLFSGIREPEDEWDKAVAEDPSLVQKLMLQDEDLGKPLIAAANGHAIAGGFVLMLAADLRVAGSGVLLGLSETKLGLIPAFGGTAKLPKHMSMALATELLLTGDNVTAEVAQSGGFVSRVVPLEQVLETAMGLANAIARNAPLAVKSAREVLNKATELSEAEAIALETERSQALLSTEDAKEGPRAFVEKRPPVFKGR